MRIIKMGKAKSSVEEYLRQKDILDVKKIDDKRKEKLFLEGISNYKNGIFSLDELSWLCEVLWSSVSHRKDSFAIILLKGAELSYNERKSIEGTSSASDFVPNLTEVLSYKAMY